MMKIGNGGGPMQNPCNICIVQAVCKEECDLLIKYLKIRIKRRVDYWYLAMMFRKGRLYLYENDTKWGYYHY